jgi:transcriptional regulator with XRE-family HTH domain
LNILERIEKDFEQVPTAIIEKLGISKSLYSMVKNNKVAVSKNLAIKIHDSYGYPLEKIFRLPPKVHDKETDLDPTGTD